MTSAETKPFDLDSASAFLRATAKNSGLAFEPDQLTAAATQLAETVERTAEGQLAYSSSGFASAFRVVKGETVEIELNEHVAGIIRRNTKPVTAPAPAAVENDITTPAAPSSAPRWAQHSTSAIADVARSIAAQEDAAIARESEGWPNPWLPGQINRTRQAIAANKNPGLAAQWKAQAGVR